MLLACSSAHRSLILCSLWTQCLPSLCQEELFENDTLGILVVFSAFKGWDPWLFLENAICDCWREHNEDKFWFYQSCTLSPTTFCGYRSSFSISENWDFLLCLLPLLLSFWTEKSSFLLTSYSVWYFLERTRCQCHWWAILDHRECM